MKIKDVFDFYSEIHCTMNMTSLEELLFNDLKNINNVSKNKLRWDEFREHKFEAFNNDKTFNPERAFIKQYIRKLGKFLLI